jgi:hypothetical protein
MVGTRAIFWSLFPLASRTRSRTPATVSKTRSGGDSFFVSSSSLERSAAAAAAAAAAVSVSAREGDDFGESGGILLLSLFFLPATTRKTKKARFCAFLGGKTVAFLRALFFSKPYTLNKKNRNSSLFHNASKIVKKFLKERKTERRKPTRERAAVSF